MDTAMIVRQGTGAVTVDTPHGVILVVDSAAYGCAPMGALDVRHPQTPQVLHAVGVDAIDVVGISDHLNSAWN